MERKGNFMVAPYVAIFRALYEEVKEKRKTEDLSLKLIKEATRIKNYNDEEFKEEIKKKEEEYYGMVLEIMELNNVKLNLLVLELIEQFIKDELIRDIWFSSIIKSICKIQMKEEIRSKILSIFNTIFESNKYIHSFYNGSLMDVYVLLFELANKNNGIGINEIIFKTTIKLFKIANNDCLNQKEENEKNNNLINDLSILLNELCNLIIGDKSTIIKNNKIQIPTNIICTIVLSNHQLFEKLNFKECLSSVIIELCIKLLDNNEFDQSLYSLITGLFTQYEIPTFMTLFSKVIQCISTTKSKEIQFALLQCILNEFLCSFEKHDTRQILPPANEFSEFAIKKYQEYINQQIVIPFSSFKLVSEFITKTPQTELIEESNCCIITKIIISIVTFLLADKDSLLILDNQFKNIFNVVEEQLRYFIELPIPIPLFKEYLIFVFNVVSLLLSNNLHEESIRIINMIINTSGLIPYQQNISQEFNEKQLTCVNWLKDCIKEFSNSFQTKEFLIILPFLSSLNTIANICPLIQTNDEIINTPNYYLNESDLMNDELYCIYIKTLVELCQTIIENYYQESFKIDKYYFDQLFNSIKLHPKRFLLIKEYIKSLFINTALHSEELINSYFFDLTNSILSQRSSNVFQKDYILFLFDVSIPIIKSTNVKAKRSLIDSYTTFIENIIITLNDSIDQLFKELSFCSNYDIVSQSFNVLKEICKPNILRQFSFKQMNYVLETLKSFLNQNNDLNIALSTIELQWSLLELISQTPELNFKQEIKESLMMILFNELLNEIDDERYDIWFSAAQTLLRAIKDQGVCLKEEGWKKLITEVFYSAFQKLKVIVYPRILNTTDIPLRDDIKKSHIISRVLTEIRRWNDSIIADLSCVMRSLKIIFEKFSDEETKKQVFRYILGFTDFAFFQPTVFGIEVGIKYVFKLLPIVYDSSIFKEVDESLADDTLDVIEMINDFLIFNDGVFSGVAILYLNMLCDSYSICGIKLKYRIIEMIKKFICLFPNDFFVSENSGTLIQERYIKALNSFIIDKDFENIKDKFETTVLWCLDTILDIEKINERAKTSKWWGINELIKILMNFTLDEQIIQRIIRSHETIISFFIEPNNQLQRSESQEKVFLNKSLHYKLEVHQLLFDILSQKLKTIDSINEINVKIIEITNIIKYKEVNEQFLIENDTQIFTPLVNFLQIIKTKSIEKSQIDVFNYFIDYGIKPSLQFKTYGQTLSQECHSILINCYLTFNDISKKSKCADVYVTHMNLITNNYLLNVEGYREQWCVLELLYSIKQIFPQIISNKPSLGNGLTIQWIYSLLIKLISSPHQPIRELIQPQLTSIGDLYFH
ncbi:hypothetical protein ENUP19_0221G0008 [Entamoeba nuttalli]|uniref:Uncharacterized protein n=2 Tax=Entamoeba nuttalli TaxID=412467 RepID=K2H5D8_ENTNP|nr:hypothetical protein ENU1_190660 [Entamoeba nuttalli P19]EKE37644.1 hypothetical protein ENU1_190660 [Entamoeba nuttalli P19]|eukprot:XP_008860024.1 hypothetical protein ENU1_190660 [Entamoeba nuttalli P19]